MLRFTQTSTAYAPVVAAAVALFASQSAPAARLSDPHVPARTGTSSEH